MKKRALYHWAMIVWVNSLRMKLMRISSTWGSDSTCTRRSTRNNNNNCIHCDFTIHEYWPHGEFVHVYFLTSGAQCFLRDLFLEQIFTFIKDHRPAIRIYWCKMGTTHANSTYHCELSKLFSTAARYQRWNISNSSTAGAVNSLACKIETKKMDSGRLTF